LEGLTNQKRGPKFVLWKGGEFIILFGGGGKVKGLTALNRTGRGTRLKRVKTLLEQKESQAWRGRLSGFTAETKQRCIGKNEIRSESSKGT